MIVLKGIYLSTIIFLCIAASSDKIPYTLSKDSSITIHGTSNLHNWDEKVENFSGSGSMDFNSDGSFDVEEITIKMDVRSIKSDKSSIMNNNTYKALKADAYPQILFSLTSPIKSIEMKNNNQMIITEGNLSIAGVTRAIEMKVKLVILEHGKLSFEGSQSIKLPDYHIKPPTALLGTLKTGDEVIIYFKANFEKKIN